ncbi:hypothetical protein K492DRAFT_173632 [Lichtheimia hyalospora FSU 10163]|nr:hypothetical protein K492DRAFT_173632 [Lichtheimia hyalospora FSU 10163]
MDHSIRDVLVQWISALKYPFTDIPFQSATTNNDNNNNDDMDAFVEWANATLSPFEKTYVSFPDYVDSNDSTCVAA